MAIDKIPEMVERVARALADEELPQCGGANSNAFATGRPAWTYFTRKAKVAIAAMREPTEAMTKGSEWLYPRYDDPHESHEDVWRAMIDAALGK